MALWLEQRRHWGLAAGAKFMGINGDVDAAKVSAPVHLVGIGASAGGIRALQSFFEALPPQLGVSFAVIVHLDPNHPSELAAVLSRSTGMQVVQVDRRLDIEPDTVYVIPPDRRLRVSDGAIETARFDEPRGHRVPIDLFFRSLAEHHGDGFAIVLSGGGSDGAVGVRAVRERGGLILVQDPEEAESSSMPRSAIASGADFVLPVKELATKLAELILGKAHVNTQALEQSGEELVRQIISLLRVKTGQDFSHYKRATMTRRLARRMQVTQTDTLEAYLTYLRDHGEETQALFNDLLISVTNFFRDPDAYGVLTTRVIPALFDANAGDRSVRVWVIGCATGEEAYSVAILLLEEAARRGVRPDIQVFATDLDGRAVAAARQGCYPDAIAADVSEERLRRFFVRESDQFQIRREVRDLVVFAIHSVLRDPPFARLDLVTCRNLMIYLDRDAQQRVCSIFNYALRPSGYLFLGSSETADSPTGLFAIVDRNARVYQSLEQPRNSVPGLLSVLTGVRLPEPARGPHPQSSEAPLNAAFHRRVLEDIAPPSMLIDRAHRVANLSETAGRYLLQPGGPMITDAAEIVRPELRLELQMALHRALEQGAPSVSLPIPVQFNGTASNVVLHVRPILRDHDPPVALVMFLEGASAEALTKDSATDPASPDVLTQVRDELSATRAVLRTTREQYETATEDLRAANEELQSTNEEYRSTAEELETSKEELQSINEELQTLNHELKLKLDTVSRAHNDLQNLITSTDVGTMFLDLSLRILRFTPRVADLFNIVAGDEGRPVTDFTHRLEYHDIVADARRVLTDLIPIERTVRTTSGRWFLVRLRPYRTLEDKIEGVVAAFVDVTEQKEAEVTWEQRQEMLLQELSHRVKNTLAVVQAITRQTLRGSVGSEVIDVLEQRLKALGNAHDLLLLNEWRGASLEALARQQLAPYLEEGKQRVQLNGPAVILPAALATPVGLVLHELGTNAAKHGALKIPGGTVGLEWQTRDLNDDLRILELTWTERGGPPVKEPHKLGSGYVLIEHGIAGAKVTRDFKTGGLVCSISVPLTLANGTKAVPPTGGEA
jgi:two-component system CheB/CheR fusion protein